MIKELRGKVIKGLGGLYDIRCGSERIVCRAKGGLKRDEDKLLVGDDVLVKIDDAVSDSVVVSEIFPRKNSLIRPPMANLDFLFIVFAAKKPTPVIETVDKLIAIAEHNKITPVLIITKSDLDALLAEEYLNIYKKVGIPAFVTSAEYKEGIAELSEYIENSVTRGKTAAFAGASGVGKSTLMNTLFPNLSLQTQTISKKIERGRHTTRHVEIFDISSGEKTGFLADTPGFSLIDFERFDFFGIDDLFSSFREFLPYVGKCRYSDCAHVGESAEECAICRAAQTGEIAPSRLDSYRSIYRVLKNKTEY